MDAIVTAIQDSGVTHAVKLSSIGAEKPEKTGPVVGLHYLEERLNAVDGLNILAPNRRVQRTIPECSER